MVHRPALGRPGPGVGTPSPDRRGRPDRASLSGGPRPSRDTDRDRDRGPGLSPRLNASVARRPTSRHLLYESQAAEVFCASAPLRRSRGRLPRVGSRRAGSPCRRTHPPCRRSGGRTVRRIPPGFGSRPCGGRWDGRARPRSSK
jgi:hypothetical protein